MPNCLAVVPDDPAVCGCPRIGEVLAQPADIRR
jgi:hypothetical protein